jgi:hypothetical protein
MMEEDIVRVLRVVLYEGPRQAVEMTINQSIHGTRVITTSKSGTLKISATTLSNFPECLTSAQQTPDPQQIVSMQRLIDELSKRNTTT